MSKPEINAIVAMNHDYAIGINNQLPWHIPEDLKYFKLITAKYPIIMGRKTFESIGRVLPGRQNIIISRDLSYSYPGAITVGSLAEAILSCGDAHKVFIIGGGEIFKQSMDILDYLYITYVDVKLDNPDVFFPRFDLNKFQLLSNEVVNTASGVKCEFCKYKRVEA